jgi:hypothetical protein
MKPDNPSPAPPSTAAALRQAWLRLRQREKQLAERAQLIETREREQQDVLARRQKELAELEVRVQNQRRKLAGLESEAARCEAAICTAAAPQPAFVTAAEQPALLLPWRVTSLIGDLKVALADVADQQRIVAEQHSKLGRVKQEWLTDWHGSLSSLAGREQVLFKREQALDRREQQQTADERRLQDHCAQLIRREQSLECWAARLAARQAEHRSERARLLALARSQNLATQARSGYLARLQARWEQERHAELARHEQACVALEAERKQQIRLGEMLRLKLQSVARKERDLLEREYVVRQAEQQLLADDPKPLEAEQELDRRLLELKRVVERPLRGLEKKERRLAAEQAKLQNLREALLEEQLRLGEARADLESSRRSLSFNHAARDSDRQRWRQRLRVLLSQRTHLRQQIHDLHEQIERLTYALLRAEEPPALALLAA